MIIASRPNKTANVAVAEETTHHRDNLSNRRYMRNHVQLRGQQSRSRETHVYKTTRRDHAASKRDDGISIVDMAFVLSSLIRAVMATIIISRRKKNVKICATMLSIFVTWHRYLVDVMAMKQSGTTIRIVGSVSNLSILDVMAIETTLTIDDPVNMHARPSENVSQTMRTVDIHQLVHK